MSTLVLPSTPKTLTFSKAVRQHLKANRNEFNADLIDAYLKDCAVHRNASEHPNRHR